MASGLTDAQKKLLGELKNYVNTWRSNNGISEEGVLSGGNLIKFVTDLQSKIYNDVSMSGECGQTLLLYTGSSAETGNWIWQEMEGFCDANPAYYYISSTDGGNILWQTKFQEAVVEAVGDKVIAERVLSGKKLDLSTNAKTRINQYAIEGTELLALDDFISSTLTQKAIENGNRVIYVAGEGWNSDSVGMQTEIPTFIQDAWIGKDIDEALNTKLTIVSDLSEITDIDSQIISDVDLRKTEFCVDAEGKVIGVKLVSGLDDINVGTFDDTGKIVTYSEKVGILSEMETIEKYNLPKDIDSKCVEAFMRHDYYEANGAKDVTIKNNGIISLDDLLAKHSFLNDASTTDVNTYRAYEYLKSIGAGDDTIRKLGLYADSDIKVKYGFLADCADQTILDEFRNYEYAKVKGIDTDAVKVMSNKNIFLDGYGKVVALGEVTSAEVASKSVYSITIGDAREFLLDATMESTYKGYNDLTPLEKIQVKQCDYDYRKLNLSLDKMTISDATMGKYLSASGKTADQLNNVDRIFMKIADGITGGNDDLANDLTKLADRYRLLGKGGKAILGTVDFVGTGVLFINAFTRANAYFESGMYTEGEGIIAGLIAEMSIYKCILQCRVCL